VTSTREETEDLGWALGSLLRSYRERVGPLTEDVPHGARGYQTLCEVVRGEQPSQLALATHLGIDRTVMTYLVDDLVDAGLVERRQNPSDRRQRQVVATAKGRRLVSRTCRKVAAAEEEVLGSLDTRERDALRRLLAKAAGVDGRTSHDPDACAVVTGD
jgi:MarR family transcriptional regulator, transcriptional regulator for hemolysin